MLVNKQMHFEVSERKVLLRVLDSVVVLVFIFLIGNALNFNYFTQFSNNYCFLILVVYINIFGTVFEMYNLQVAGKRFLVFKSIFFTTTGTIVSFLLTPFFTTFLPSSRYQILVFFLTVLVALFIWRLFYIYFLVSQRFIKKIILVCDKSQLKQLVLGIKANEFNYQILGYVNTDASQDSISTIDYIKDIAIDDIENFVIQNNISEIVIANKDAKRITSNLSNHLIHLLESGYTIRNYTEVYEYANNRMPLKYVQKDFYRYFPFSRNNQNKLYLFLFRFLDILIASIGILFLMMITPLIIIANFIGNKGALFYTQERVGKSGKIFNIYKFRSMVKNAEANGAVFALTNDTRVTPFGKFLRKSRIDEIPQFLNVLKNDMSIIGPRPERPVFVYEIAQQMPFYQIRHIIKPGLTGWAQVCYPYGASINDSLIKLEYDLYYIKHRSIFLDLKIVVKTLSTVLFYRGQ